MQSINFIKQTVSEKKIFKDFFFQKGLESTRRDFGLKTRENIIESYFCG